MNRFKSLQGPCGHCGRSIEYPAHLVGTTATCPHCGQVTELALATPPREPAVPRRVLLFTAIAVLILVLGLVASFVALKWAQSRSSRPSEPPAVPVQQ